MGFISQVFFSDARVKRGVGGPTQKLVKLLEISPLAERIAPGDIVAIKMHFGEPGNARYIRPIFPVLVADFIKKCGGRPFVTDTTVVYKSERKDFFTYLECARRNGFTSEVLGCPLVISGGFRDHGIKVGVHHPIVLPEITVSQEIWGADFLFSLAHFTMHLDVPFAASLKNISMGCVTQDTKMKMHTSKGQSSIPLNTQAAIVDGAKAVLDRFKGKIFACNIALDITPECDCFGKTDLPVVPDLGIFVSPDVVACDKAVFDAVIASPGYPGCIMEGREGMKAGGNKISACHPKQHGWAEYEDFLRQAGIGNLEYELVTI